MKLPYITIFYFVFTIMGLLGLVYMHELAHSEIYKLDGINSEIKMFDMKHFGTAVTIAERECKTENCMFLHGLNEVIGYHLIAFASILIIIFAPFVFLIDLYLDKEDSK
jgi:hypothetical protein